MSTPVKPIKAISKSSGGAHAYLIFYNTLNLLIWASLLILTLRQAYGLVTNSKGSLLELDQSAKLRPYTALGAFLTYATTFTCLEVLHVALGLVKTSIGPTFTQAFGRTWTVWGVLYTLSTSRSSFAFTGLALAWSISEVVRYSFYVSNLIYGKPLGFVQWARYNLFIVLYPLGAGCEWWLMWRGLGEAREWWGLYAGWMVFSMAVYPLLFPGQYWYMVKQRRKVMKARREEVERKGQ